MRRKNAIPTNPVGSGECGVGGCEVTRRRRILGLDSGETTGWALVEVNGTDTRVVDYGVIAVPCKPSSEAAILTTTRRELAAMLAVMKANGLELERVAIEAPAYNRNQNKFADEIRGVCKEAVAAAGLGWYLIAPQTAKAALGVKPRRKDEPKRGPDVAKKAVKAAVEARFGLSNLNYHEADAVAVALAATNAPEAAGQRSPAPNGAGTTQHTPTTTEAL